MRDIESSINKKMAINSLESTQYSDNILKEFKNNYGFEEYHGYDNFFARSLAETIMGPGYKVKPWVKNYPGKKEMDLILEHMGLEIKKEESKPERLILVKKNLKKTK